MSQRPPMADVLKLSLDEYARLYVKQEQQTQPQWDSQVLRRRRYDRCHYFAPSYQRQQLERLQQQRLQQQRLQLEQQQQQQKQQQLEGTDIVKMEVTELATGHSQQSLLQPEQQQQQQPQTSLLPQQKQQVVDIEFKHQFPLPPTHNSTSAADEEMEDDFELDDMDFDMLYIPTNFKMDE